MESHERYLQRILAAPKDISLPIFQGLLRKGYNMTRWQKSASAKDSACIGMNNRTEPLDEFIGGLSFAAPIYEKTHVGCTCSVLVTKANEDGTPDDSLEPVIVNAFGEE